MSLILDDASSIRFWSLPEFELENSRILLGAVISVPTSQLETLCPLKAADLLVREWLAHKDEFLKFKEEHSATHRDRV